MLHAVERWRDEIAATASGCQLRQLKIQG
jgi:hypothetical protein